MREQARSDDRPGAYDKYLAGLTKTHDLEDVVERLVSDCFGE